VEVEEKEGDARNGAQEEATGCESAVVADASTMALEVVETSPQWRIPLFS